MHYLATLLASILAFISPSFGSVPQTASSDTLNTLRANVNSLATVVNSGISTSTTLTKPHLLYVTGAGTVSDVATSSASCSGAISCSSFTVVGSVAPTISGSASVTSVTGTYPVQSSGGSTPVMSIAFSTTTANSWNHLQQFTANASTSQLSVTSTAYFSGQVRSSANQPATSTSMTLDWATTAQQIEYRIGTSATTITLVNATTSAQWGSRKLVYVCNPNASAGALTWKGIEWIGTVPTQTTTANQCDVYSFDVTHATSTTAYKVAGTVGTGFK